MNAINVITNVTEKDRLIAINVTLKQFSNERRYNLSDATLYRDSENKMVIKRPLKYYVTI